MTPFRSGVQVRTAAQLRANKGRWTVEGPGFRVKSVKPSRLPRRQGACVKMNNTELPLVANLHFCVCLEPLKKHREIALARWLWLAGAWYGMTWLALGRPPWKRTEAPPCTSTRSPESLSKQGCILSNKSGIWAQTNAATTASSAASSLCSAD